MQNSEEFYKLYDFQKFGGHSKSLGLCPQTYSLSNNSKKKKKKSHSDGVLVAV